MLYVYVERTRIAHFSKQFFREERQKDGTKDNKESIFQLGMLHACPGVNDFKEYWKLGKIFKKNQLESNNGKLITNGEQ